MANRCRVQMSIERFREVEDKIVSREEGEQRNEILRDYDIENNEFISKLKRDDGNLQAPLGIVSKEPSDEKDKFNSWLSTNSGFVQGLTETTMGSVKAPTRLDDVQVLLIDSDYRFVWTDKTRQFGYSYIIAARAFAKAMLLPTSTSIFVSYNEEESKEKIVYSLAFYESLPRRYQLSRRLKYNNKTSLVFEKSGANSSETRILSYPQRVIRGKGGGVDVYFDEAAHCIHLRKIYTSAVPVLSRGQSSFWMGSSPAGKSGLFYEIGVNQDNNYPEYIRLHVNWWDIPAFCKDVSKARELAAGMITDQRVAMFGTDQIKSIRRSMLLEEFQQEYECAYLDESYSYFPWDMIMKCVPIYSKDEETIDFDAPGNDISEHDKLASGKGVEYFHGDGAFENFMKAIQDGRIKGGILGGYDVARSQDGSEVVFVEEDNNHNHTVRCNVELKKMPLPEQRTLITSMFKALGRRLLKFGVDYNGIGTNIAEDLQALSYDTVVCLPFNNNAWKEEATRKLRYRMEVGQLLLPTHRPLLNQIHSIKRILLPGGQWRFDTVENAKHHGDKYWALIAASDVGYPVLESANTNYDLDPRVMPKDGKKKPKGIISPRHSPVVPVFAISGGHLNPYSNIPGMSIPNLPAPRIPSGLMPAHSAGFEFPA